MVKILCGENYDGTTNSTAKLPATKPRYSRGLEIRHATHGGHTKKAVIIGKDNLCGFQVFSFTKLIKEDICLSTCLAICQHCINQILFFVLHFLHTE